MVANGGGGVVRCEMFLFNCLRVQISDGDMVTTCAVSGHARLGQGCWSSWDLISDQRSGGCES